MKRYTILSAILLALTAEMPMAQVMSPITKFALAYPKQPSDSERNAAMRPYQWPADSLNAILEDEEYQVQDFADYPDPMPDSFVIWGRDDKLVTPEQFVDIFIRDMAMYDSLSFAYRQHWVEYRRKTMLQPEMLLMPKPRDYFGVREAENEEMLDRLITEIIVRMPQQHRHNVTGP